MEEKKGLGGFLFGRISRKLGLAFGILVLLLVIIVGITYNLNKTISEDTLYIREVNSPLQLMSEQVLSYDGILTGNTHAALLHVLEGDLKGYQEHRTKYDEVGILMDNLLKIEAPNLLNKSRRSKSQKSKVYGYLSKLDEVNLKLVSLELNAFEKMESGDTKGAYDLIIGGEYVKYKEELAELYANWAVAESEVTEEVRERVLENSRKVQIYNLFLGIIFIFIAIIISILTSRTITRPLDKLSFSGRQLAERNFKTRVDIKTGDEFEELGESFNKTAEALERMEDEYKKLDNAKTEFLSITSHELRSPMTPMKAQLQMLLGGYFGKLNSEQKEALSMVERNTSRLDKIIVDFLEISRIEAARLKFNFQKAKISDCVSRLAKEMNGFLPKKKIKILTKLEKLPLIEFDPDRTGQILRNLVSNAKKFSPVGSKIEIGAKAYEGKILFWVKDEGIGIKRDDKEKIFEPFFQVENMYQHKTGGTGLGLAIARGIVESQEGKIWLKSIYKKGTTFYFTLPLKPVRKIKPIKLLFSKRKGVRERLNDLFKEILGPMGDEEFSRLKTVNRDELLNYISDLEKRKILSKIGVEDFKNKIDVILGRKSGEKTELPEKITEEFFGGGK